MGLGTKYKLPEQYSTAFKVIGDGVAVPAVSFIRDRLLNPILKLAKKPRARPKKASRPASVSRKPFQPQTSDRSTVRVESF
jgi:DNA (cytosine-5)-methyltransferase 1